MQSFQYELQYQEALLVLMRKLKANQRVILQTSNVNQRTTTSTKLNSTTPTKLSSVYTDT